MYRMLCGADAGCGRIGAQATTDVQLVVVPDRPDAESGLCGPAVSAAIGRGLDDLRSPPTRQMTHVIFADLNSAAFRGVR